MLLAAIAAIAAVGGAGAAAVLEYRSLKRSRTPAVGARRGLFTRPMRLPSAAARCSRRKLQASSSADAPRGVRGVRRSWWLQTHFERRRSSEAFDPPGRPVDRRCGMLLGDGDPGLAVAGRWSSRSRVASGEARSADSSAGIGGRPLRDQAARPRRGALVWTRSASRAAFSLDETRRPGSDPGAPRAWPSCRTRSVINDGRWGWSGGSARSGESAPRAGHA